MIRIPTHDIPKVQRAAARRFPPLLRPLLSSMLLAATVAACARPATEPAVTASVAAARVAAARVAAPAVPDDDADRYSVLDLASTWRDQHGAARGLASLRGRPQVIAMIYTHCATTCPVTVTEMKQVERSTGDRVGFVLVTLDPTRDTTAQLAAFARDRALAPERWTLLSGTDDDVRELAAVLGIRYRRLSPDELAHSNTYTVLDASGTVVYQRAGLDGVNETLAALRALP